MSLGQQGGDESSDSEQSLKAEPTERSGALAVRLREKEESTIFHLRNLMDGVANC